MFELFAFSLCPVPGPWCLPGKSLCTCLTPWFLWLPSRPVLLDHLALVASGTYMCGSPRTATNGEAVLHQLPPLQGTAQKQQSSMHLQYFCGRGLLAYLPNCGLKGKLLIKSTSEGQLSSPLDTREAGSIIIMLPLLRPRSSEFPAFVAISLALIAWLWWPEVPVFTGLVSLH